MTTPHIPAVQRPLLRRIWFYIVLKSSQLFIRAFIRIQRLVKPLKPNQKPTLLKTYPVRNHLTNRIFIPDSHQAGDTLPLYISIHGGGFAICTPEFDDEWNAHLCHTYKILVVSLDYTKSPAVRFPVATHDIEELVKAVLSDDSLPIDKSRVVIGGFSAGGNLALSAAQAPALRGKIHGVVPFYPVVEFVTNAAQKIKTRPYRNKDDVDGLLKMSPLFNWGYVSPGQNLADPRLSPAYASKDDLPKWIFMIAAEFDMLSAEAREMILNLAGVDESQHAEVQYGFERGTYRWKLIREVEHGYTQSFGPASEGELARKGQEVTFTEVSKWLFSGPFAKN